MAAPMFTKTNFLIFLLPALLLSSLLSIGRAAASEVEDEIPFEYLKETGKGPGLWGRVNPNWKVCDNGKMQSPIDLMNERVKTFSNLGKLKRDYKPAPAVVKNRGHDVEVKWAGDAGEININGTSYKLKQCHWHTPSEHTFNGTRYNLEVHMVHMSSKEEIAVVGITYKFGKPDPFLAKLIPSIKSLGKEEKHVGIINPSDIEIGSRKYFRYIGSLTIPPCTEGVIWTIVKKVRTVSREQVRELREVVHDGFEANSRPTQHHKGRAIWFYTP